MSQCSPVWDPLSLDIHLSLQFRENCSHCCIKYTFSVPFSSLSIIPKMQIPFLFIMTHNFFRPLSFIFILFCFCFSDFQCFCFSNFQCPTLQIADSSSWVCFWNSLLNYSVIIFLILGYVLFSFDGCCFFFGLLILFIIHFPNFI